MHFDVKITGITEVIRRFERIAKQEVPFGLAKCLTDTARVVKIEEVKEMERIFDRPTPFVKNALYLKPATKTNLSAEVGFKDTGAKEKALRIIGPHVYGGDREKKRSEQWLGEWYVPGKGARLNKYGNMSPGQVTQVLSVLGKLPDKYQNITARSRKKNKKPRDYFMLRSKKGGLIPGVYEKHGAKRKGRPRKIRPIMIFIKQPAYRKVFPFHEIGMEVARKRLVPNFVKAMHYAMDHPR
jgi:hypothetical protein